MFGDLIELIGSLFSTIASHLPYNKRMVKVNLEWVKQQDWFLHYTSDPKWENMITNDKRMLQILGSYQNEKLLHDEELQTMLKQELIDTYEMWKLSWTLK